MSKDATSDIYVDSEDDGTYKLYMKVTHDTGDFDNLEGTLPYTITPGIAATIADNNKSVTVDGTTVECDRIDLDANTANGSTKQALATELASRLEGALTETNNLVRTQTDTLG